ncbi:FAD binding domain-containing protein [Demequina sp. NBRC 110056]|uniref:FAD binding domain-containing protein n=1 Tax=Demequina sp. NBRC 110056 TaxID=1570345 RepID=UPI001F3E30CA|nr:FAD binding domain-containing protein [Demequina sp. NBRC 110056]
MADALAGFDTDRESGDVDLTAVETMRVARSRADLALAPGETFLAGGTWLYSEAQPDVTGLVDLSSLGWDELEVTADGDLRIGALTPIAALEAYGRTEPFRASALLAQCADSLLASFKVRASATVGGNIAKGYAAGAMIALAATLDGEALIWRADGTDDSVPVAALPTGNGSTSLAPGDALREVVVPARALAARTAHRRIALAEHGRSGALVTGRRDEDGTHVIVITAATLTPVVLRYADAPSADAVVADALAAPGHYTDPLGSEDWRRHVSSVLAREVAEELASGDGA